MVQCRNDITGNMRRFFIRLHRCDDRQSEWQQTHHAYFCFRGIFDLPSDAIEIFIKEKRGLVL